jgi:phosphomannomutase
MQIKSSIFKGYDIRAIYPTEINEENIQEIVKAIHTYLTKDHKKPIEIVVGTDMRTSSPSLTKASIQMLMELGANVVDIGIVSTPSFYFAVSYYKYDAGVQITASHNPKEYNGIKIVKKGKNGLIKIGKTTGLDEIQEILAKKDFVTSDNTGTYTKKTDFLQEEVENAMKIIENPKIKKFKIAADAANAMGSQYINALFAKIPADLIRMNFDLDGTFPAHQPDPLQKETLVDLQKKVVDEHADLGLAPDGDGDRLFFVDEKGEIVNPTVITSIVAKELLKKNKGENIFVDIRYIFTPKKIIEESGGKMIITKVGHAYITEAMNKYGGLFAGESSGHYFFKDTANAESQMPIILIILSVLSRENKSFSKIVEEYSRSYESGEINFKLPDSKKTMLALEEKYSDGSLDEMDGLAINYPTWRFSVRISNTEPLLRLNIESYSKNELEKKKQELVNFIKNMS